MGLELKFRAKRWGLCGCNRAIYSYILTYIRMYIYISTHVDLTAYLERLKENFANCVVIFCGVHDNCTFLCYYAASSGKILLTFRDNLTGLSSCPHGFVTLYCVSQHYDMFPLIIWKIHISGLFILPLSTLMLHVYVSPADHISVLHLPLLQRLRWSRGSVLAFGTQLREFKPGQSRRIFSGRKYPQHAFLRKGSKAGFPM